jgi:uncharacterized membrane protein YraQ (UPF0718 family)
MDLTTFILILISGVLLIVIFTEDKTLVISRIKSARISLWENLAILLVGFLLAGLIQVLILKELITNLPIAPTS